jgi:hypothetical protein
LIEINSAVYIGDYITPKIGMKILADKPHSEKMSQIFRGVSSSMSQIFTKFATRLNFKNVKKH